MIRDSARGGRAALTNRLRPATTKRGSSSSEGIRTQALERSCSMVANWQTVMDSRSAFSAFPGFDHLYEFADPGSDRAFVASIDVLTEMALPMLRGEMRRVTPIEGRWAMGSAKPADIVWTTVALPVLLSERAVDLLRKEHVTGWDLIPCTLYGKQGESWPYAFLTVHGRCGPIDDLKSTRIDKTYPAGVFPAWKGLYFDPRSWDGSDVFMPAGDVGWIFVTERLKSVLEKAKVGNVLCTPLDQVERVQLSRKRNSQAS